MILEKAEISVMGCPDCRFSTAYWFLAEVPEHRKHDGKLCSGVGKKMVNKKILVPIKEGFLLIPENR